MFALETFIIIELLCNTFIFVAAGSQIVTYQSPAQYAMQQPGYPVSKIKITVQ